MWCRLTAIADIVMGSSPNGTSINTNGQGVEFHQGKIFFTNKFIGKSDKTTTEPTKIAKENSVLLCVRAPVGEVNITNREICIGRGLSSIHPIGEINVNFLFYWLKTYKEHLNLQATGSTFVAITADTVKEILLPLPPLTEQEKIVTAIQDADIFLNEIKRSF